MSASLDHVGISVPNIENGIKWYKKTFDLFQISEIMEVFSEKDQIAKEFSDTLLNVANKAKDHTYLVIDEVPGENWAVGDKFFG